MRGATFGWRWPLVAASIWVARYLTIDALPCVARPIWATWFDQGKYLASATALAHGVLDPAAHWYPLGYALLAAPFVRLCPANPFFLVDLALYLATYLAFWRVAARLRIGPAIATICFVATSLVDTKLAGSWLNPWTTTLSAAMIWWSLDRVLTIREQIERGGSTDTLLWSIGALAAALPLVRPVDGLIGATCLVLVSWSLAAGSRLSAGALIRLAGGGMAVAAGYAALHLAIYGPHLSDYVTASARIGFVWSDLPWKAYILLVHARPWYPDGTAILERLPWIVPGAAGLMTAAFLGAPPARRTCRLMLALTIPVTLVMLAYVDLLPPGLWYFANIHYFKWLMPAFGAGIVLLWRQLVDRRQRTPALVLLAVVTLPLGIRVVPVTVDDAAPARMLVFAGTTGRPFDDVYFPPMSITDRVGTLRNVYDFRQLPDPIGVRAIAIRRLFGRDPRRTDPGDRRAPVDQPAIGRFAGRLSYVGFR